MLQALRVKTTVLPGHRIEIQSPDLPEGQSVSVFIILEEDEAPKRPFFDVLGDYAGGDLFKSAEEVDAYLRGERESWGPETTPPETPKP
jgi:hypothetical protein